MMRTTEYVQARGLFSRVAVLSCWLNVLYLQKLFQVIYQTRDTVFHHISNTKKRVENMTRSGVFLMNFEVFHVVMKHCDECKLLKQTDFLSLDIQTCHGA